MRWSTICLKTAPLQAALQLAILHAKLRQRMQRRNRLRLQHAILRAKVRQRIETSRGQIAMRTSRCQAAAHIGSECSL